MRNRKKRKIRYLVSALMASVLLQSGMPAYAVADDLQQASEESGIEPFSLLPIEEKEAYLLLNEYSQEQLKEMPLETVLGLIKDMDGNTIQFPEDASIVWAYFKDAEGNILEDVYHEIGRDTIVDMTCYRYTKSYTMELIVGSGNQLDADNIRYIVKVFITDTFAENISYEVYEATSSGGRKRVENGGIIATSSSVLENIGVPVTQVSYMTPSYQDGKSYLLGIDSSLSESQKDIRVDVYPMKKFLEYYCDGKPLQGAITDDILNQRLWSGGGYQGLYQEKADTDADNFFCVVYANAETGEVLAYQGLVFVVCAEEYQINGTIYAYEAGNMKNITDSQYTYSSSSNSWQINLGGDTNGVDVTYYNWKKYENNTLKAGYSAEEYYIVLDKNEHIKKIVLGNYITEESAARAEDITEQIMPSDRRKVPYGYQSSGEKNQIFTIFFDDGIAVCFCVSVSGGKTTVEYDDAPITSGTDPYFRVSGAAGYDRKTYIVNNQDKYVNGGWSEQALDTLYAVGYQTIFILDQEADLSTLKPIFYCPDNVQVSVGEKQESGVSEQDFSDGWVQYEVYVDDNLKNYRVTFAKEESGAKLFVNGPDTREIFLDEYFENRHDILIANLGDTALTGLKVELVDAVHVKLDDYWTLGQTGNDTLGAFDSVSSSASYGELANIAKIRLLPDGEGEVSGTLKISADGQETVCINLTGHAGNPKIITEALSDGVKYVPYSYVVATDNMHTWNEVTFKITKGSLPEGLTLNSATGEIYGVPQEAGEFPVTVKAEYSRKEFSASSAEFTLTVKQNTNDNVYAATDEGYRIETHVGTETADGTHDYILEEIGDQLFVSSGEYKEFIDFWLNGQKLEAGVDYDKESGSTRITIRSQTFAKKAQNGCNTIAAEFRVDGEKNKELKRTVQNFRLNLWEDDDHEDDFGGDNSDQENSGFGEENSDSGNNHFSAVQESGSQSTGAENKENAEPKKAQISAPDGTWMEDETGWWYQISDGTWLANTWMQIPGEVETDWYFFDENGYMVTDWYLVDGEWYYLNPLSDGRKGKMLIGWQLIDGEWYYLNPISDGEKGKMLIGWQLIDGTWYYFQEMSDGRKGSMRANEWIGPYYVNENGAWVE